MTEATPDPLAGILVADFSRALAGRYATMRLGDLGATVVKVERRDVGDETRRGDHLGRRVLDRQFD